MGALIDAWQQRIAKIDSGLVSMIIRKQISRSKLADIVIELEAIAAEIDKALNIDRSTS